MNDIVILETYLANDPAGQKMTDERYIEILANNADTDVTVTIDILDVSLLLGSIRLMLQNEGVQDFGHEFNVKIALLRDKLVSRLAAIGLSDEEIDAFDRFYT